jgi:O-acetyl-ADP-ribose deacetylase (regulator of RNase III)
MPPDLRFALQLELRSGDLLQQFDVDAIVLPASDYLLLGGRLGGEVRRRGGEEIDREAQRLGPVGLGDAVATTAGRLPFRCIIHAAVYGLAQDDLRRPKQKGTFTEGEVIAGATLNALSLAQLHRLHSIAMPPLGVEAADFPADQVADIMLGHIHEFAKANPESSLEKIVIVASDQPTYRIFQEKMIQSRAA